MGNSIKKSSRKPRKSSRKRRSRKPRKSSRKRRSRKPQKSSRKRRSRKPQKSSRKRRSRRPQKSSRKSSVKKKNGYFICSNRAVYFFVLIKKDISIYDATSFKKIKTIKNPKHVFIGRCDMDVDTNDREPIYDGNSILVQTGNLEYTYIGGWDIFEFKTKEPIIDYVSNMGNNLVPYPYAITKNYCYMMLEKVYFPKEESEDYDDPYVWYYDNEKNSSVKTFKVKKLKAKVKNEDKTPWYISMITGKIKEGDYDNHEDYENNKNAYKFFKDLMKHGK